MKQRGIINRRIKFDFYIFAMRHLSISTFSSFRVNSNVIPGRNFVEIPDENTRIIMMSEEKISLELLGARVATLTDRINDLELDVRDLKIRFTSLEQRFSSLEQRFGIQKERMSRMLAVLVPLAERQEPAPALNRGVPLERPQ